MRCGLLTQNTLRRFQVESVRVLDQMACFQRSRNQTIRNSVIRHPRPVLTAAGFTSRLRWLSVGTKGARLAPNELVCEPADSRSGDRSEQVHPNRVQVA
jgi:hypothetical protein